MDRLTDEELRRLAADVESVCVERKLRLENRETRDKAARALCAFANDLLNTNAPGVLFIGVDDAGRGVGTPFGQAEEQQLGQLLVDGKTQPIPVHEVRTVEIDGHRCVAIVVRPYSAPPVRYGGDIWVRRAARVDRATPEDERVLSERRRHGDLPFDSRPVRHASIHDLDIRLFQIAYLPAVQSRATIEENNRPVEHQLRAQRLMTADGHPTYAGVLLVGLDPRHLVPDAFVQMVRIDGTDRADPVADHRTLSGPLVRLPEQLVSQLDAWNVTPLEVTGLRHKSAPDYAPIALREFMMNALVHRSYEHTGAPISVYWFNDRVEIRSPGGPYGDVTKERFGEPGFVSYRNPRLAEAFKGLEFIEHFGRGIVVAQRALKDNGNRPAKLDAQDHSVTVTLFRRPR